MKRALTELILSAALFLIALAGYAYWYHLLGVADERVHELAAAADAQSQNALAADRAADELKALSSAESDIEGYFVVPANIVSFLEALQSLGAGEGADVSVVSVTANPSGRPHLDLALSISGSFAAVARTVGAIEYSPYDISVTSLTVSTAETDASAPWTAAVKLSVGTASSTPPKTP